MNRMYLIFKRMQILKGKNFHHKDRIWLECQVNYFVQSKAAEGYYNEFLSFNKPNNILLVWWEEELD